MKNVVGPRIRALRRRKNLTVTQEELVARLQTMGVDIDQSALSRIENGERQITDIELLAVARALGVEVAAAFVGAMLPEIGKQEHGR